METSPCGPVRYEPCESFTADLGAHPGAVPTCRDCGWLDEDHRVPALAVLAGAGGSSARVAPVERRRAG